MKVICVPGFPILYMVLGDTADYCNLTYFNGTIAPPLQSRHLNQFFKMTKVWNIDYSNALDHHIMNLLLTMNRKCK